MGLQKSGGGWKNVSPTTGKRFSKKPLSKKQALKQLRAIQRSKHLKGGSSRKGSKKK